MELKGHLTQRNSFGQITLCVIFYSRSLGTLKNLRFFYQTDFTTKGKNLTYGRKPPIFLPVIIEAIVERPHLFLHACVVQSYNWSKQRAKHSFFPFSNNFLLLDCTHVVWEYYRQQCKLTQIVLDGKICLLAFPPRTDFLYYCYNKNFKSRSTSYLMGKNL